MADTQDPDYAKAEKALKEALPKGTDPMEVWEALKGAGLTITAAPEVSEEGTAPTSPESGIPPEAAPSGAPIEGEPPVPRNDGFQGPPTDDLVRKAFQMAQSETT